MISNDDTAINNKERRFGRRVEDTARACRCRQKARYIYIFFFVKSRGNRAEVTTFSYKRLQFITRTDCRALPFESNFWEVKRIKVERSRDGSNALLHGENDFAEIFKNLAGF